MDEEKNTPQGPQSSPIYQNTEVAEDLSVQVAHGRNTLMIQRMELDDDLPQDSPQAGTEQNGNNDELVVSTTTPQCPDRNLDVNLPIAVYARAPKRPQTISVRTDLVLVARNQRSHPAAQPYSARKQPERCASEPLAKSKGSVEGAAVEQSDAPVNNGAGNQIAVPQPTAAQQEAGTAVDLSNGKRTPRKPRKTQRKTSTPKRAGRGWLNPHPWLHNPFAGPRPWCTPDSYSQARGRAQQRPSVVVHHGRANNTSTTCEQRPNEGTFISKTLDVLPDIIKMILEQGHGLTPDVVNFLITQAPFREIPIPMTLPQQMPIPHQQQPPPPLFYYPFAFPPGAMGGHPFPTGQMPPLNNPFASAQAAIVPSAPRPAQSIWVPLSAPQPMPQPLFSATAAQTVSVHCGPRGEPISSTREQFFDMRLSGPAATVVNGDAQRGGQTNENISTANNLQATTNAAGNEHIEEVQRLHVNADMAFEVRPAAPGQAPDTVNVDVVWKP